MTLEQQPPQRETADGPTNLVRPGHPTSANNRSTLIIACHLFTTDADDEKRGDDLGRRRMIIKKITILTDDYLLTHKSHDAVIPNRPSIARQAMDIRI